MQKEGNIFIISAASGTGKTTLVSRLVQGQPDIRVSVSHTTRAPRGAEQNGVHYHFVDNPEFTHLIKENAFLEHALVFGNHYGTSYAAIDSLTQKGINVILEIDVQGAAQVRKHLPEACSIFILPPSMSVLANRLQNRGTDNSEVIQTRLQEACREIEQAHFFDYAVINGDLDKAEQDLLHIIRARGLKQTRQHHFIKQLLANAS